MQGFETIINSIITLGLAMLIGFVCIKTKYISSEQNNGMSKIVVRVTLPILVITSLTSLDFDREKLINSVHVFLISAVVIALLYAIGTLMTKIGKMNREKTVMHRCMTCLGNVVFMAFPLIKALYGAEGLLYAAVYELANDMFLWTIGVYSMNTVNRGQKSFAAHLKRVLNPGTIAFAAAFVMMAFGFKFTGVVGTVLDGIGSTTTYLSMFFIGGTLAQVDFRHIYKRVGLFALTLIKMIALPAILILVLNLLSIDDTAKAVIILQAAMPTSTVLVILGMEYGGDTVYCAEGVFITHLAGLVTLPLVYYLMSMISVIR
jgi:hypothetical protein